MAGRKVSTKSAANLATNFCQFITSSSNEIEYAKAMRLNGNFSFIYNVLPHTFCEFIFEITFFSYDAIYQSNL